MRKFLQTLAVCSIASASFGFTLDTSNSSTYGLTWNNGMGSYGTAAYKYLDSASYELTGVYSYLNNMGYTVHTIGNVEGVVKLNVLSILDYGDYFGARVVGLAWSMQAEGTAFQSLSYTLIDHLSLSNGYEHWLNCTQLGSATMVNELCGNWDHDTITGNYAWQGGPDIDQFNERLFVFGYYEEGTDGSKNIYLADGVRLTLNAHMAAVPEPVSLIFVGAGLGLLLKRRLRR